MLEILDKLKIFINQYQIYLYQTGILNRGIKIYTNLPPFLKRTTYNTKEFKSLLRNFLYSNPFYTMDKNINHNATAW